MAVKSDSPKNRGRKRPLIFLAALMLAGGSAVMFTGMEQSAQSAPAPVIDITGATLAQTSTDPEPTTAPTSGANSTTAHVSLDAPAGSVAEKPADPPAVPSVSYPASTLNIPSVGISAPIVSGGQNAGGMILPESSKVAEFIGAAALTSPKGSTVIAGHVNFADGSAGALGPLYEVQIGAPVYATDASGAVHEYKVVSSTVLSKQGLPSNLFRTSGSKQLVLVTCGGELEMVNGALAYTHNQVVTAEPV